MPYEKCVNKQNFLNKQSASTIISQCVTPNKGVGCTPMGTLV